MTPRFFVPPLEFSEFAQLPTSARLRLHDLFTALRVIHEAPNKTKAARELQMLANGRRGMSATALLSAYRRYLKHDGDWRVLVPAYHRPRPRAIRTEGGTARVSASLAAFIRRGTRHS